ncbi:MAG: hypothetical protein FJ009_03235 [Chloroflexi bacterium]|nr:hypothetical protein [Chloroflexota bacterium]
MKNRRPKPFALALMPFGKEFNNIYRSGIKAAALHANVDCARIDEQIFEEDILNRIYGQIAEADIVIADMTGRNPNVYYETGYAHALNKRVILLTQDAEDIPFDLKHYPHVIYGGNVSKLRSQLGERIQWYIEHPREMVLPQERIFQTLEDFYKYVVHRIANSNRIDDLSWAKPDVKEQTLADKIGYENYLKAKEMACQREGVIYREVYTFPNWRRFERAKTLIERKHYGYSAAYHPITARDTIPRMSFIIFDSKEVAVFFYLSSHTSSYRELKLSMTYPNIVALFQDYYDDIFGSGIILKDALSINRKELAKLEKQFHQSSET